MDKSTAHIQIFNKVLTLHKTAPKASVAISGPLRLQGPGISKPPDRASGIFSGNYPRFAWLVQSFGDNQNIATDNHFGCRFW